MVLLLNKENDQGKIKQQMNPTGKNRERKHEKIMKDVTKLKCQLFYIKKALHIGDREEVNHIFVLHI